MCALLTLPRAGAGYGETQETARGRRDPFWPVGYTPPEEPGKVEEQEEPAPDEPEIEPPDWDAAAKMLKFQGTFRARGRILANINGQIVEKGSIIGIRLPPYIYHWRITAIHTHDIETEPIEAIPARLNDNPGETRAIRDQ